MYNIYDSKNGLVTSNTERGGMLRIPKFGFNKCFQIWSITFKYYFTFAS